MSHSSTLRSLLAWALLWTLTACPRPEPVPCKRDVDCASGNSCVDGTCQPCPACGLDETCVRAQCLPVACGDRPCHEGEGCVGGLCAAGDCVAVQCAASEACAKGSCYPVDCGAQTCIFGDVCYQGACRQPPCAEVTCAPGTLCAAGDCLPSACQGVVCGPNTVCQEGRCVSVYCVGIVCPAGRLCDQGACREPGIDAGTDDAGYGLDAEVADASLPDAGVPDARAPDSGGPDAGCVPSTTMPCQLAGTRRCKANSSWGPCAHESLLAPTADTSLWDLQPGANNGAAPEMSCGATGAPDAGNLAGSACLFQFDLSSIPNDATVTAAMLTLCTTKQDGCCASSFDAFALLVPWREMEASWIDRQTGKQWAVSGAQGSLDREAAPSTAGSVAMWYPPPAGCFKFVITGLAQRWVAGTLPNNGVKVQATSGSGAMSVGVASLQYAPDAGSTASRPELLVDWTQP